MSSQKPGNAKTAEQGESSAISAELWPKVKQLFAAAVQLAPSAREAFLDRECGGNSALRSEVESLLAFADSSTASQPPSLERPTLTAGTRLGEYEVVSLLGSGGFGDAYHAHDLRLHRDVAIKVLPPALSADAAALRRFEREALAAARLNHPHIVTIHAMEHVGGVHLIVMELVEGESLECMIPVTGLALEKFLDLAGELADAVAVAHGKGIIHRDLKPSNIMVDKRGSIKILDFGIAKMTELAAGQPFNVQDTETGMVMGTVPYMSPEQLEGKKLDARTDVFSLGAVLYQMITGQRPFRGDTQAELILSILRHKPKPVVELRADVPVSMQRVLERCLSKHATERFESSEVRDAIQKLRDELASGRRSASDVARIRSLAVLPLENLSHDPDQEYFAEGLTEALITTLAKIGELRVASRTSVMQYKGVHKPVNKIARELEVDAIVEGTVLRVGRKVRITAQLIEATNDRHLWAESYERDLRHILALQADVAQAIAREIQVKLTPMDQARFSAVHAVEPAAYEAYLKGRYHWNGRHGLRKAIQCFEHAITLDPTYAAAYAGLADCFSALMAWGQVPPHESSVKAKRLAQKALAMDSTLAEAHTSLALVVMYEYNFYAAEKEFERAIELNPRYATAHHLFGFYLGAMSRYEESVTELRRAVRLDPLSPLFKCFLGFVYLYARRYDQAIDEFRKALEVDSDLGPALSGLGWAYRCKLLHGTAIATLRKAVELRSADTAALAWLGEAYAAAGHRQKAQKTLEQLNQLSKERYVSPYVIARVHAGLSETEEALRHLEAAYAQRAGWMVLLRVDPCFDDLRPTVRFQDLLRRMNFPETS